MVNFFDFVNVNHVNLLWNYSYLSQFWSKKLSKSVFSKLPGSKFWKKDEFLFLYHLNHWHKPFYFAEGMTPTRPAERSQKLTIIQRIHRVTWKPGALQTLYAENPEGFWFLIYVELFKL